MHGTEGRRISKDNGFYKLLRKRMARFEPERQYLRKNKTNEKVDKAQKSKRYGFRVDVGGKWRVGKEKEMFSAEPNI